MKALHDNIIVEEVKETSVVITTDDTKKTKPSYGKVLYVGPGQSYGLPAFEPTKVNVGDVVCFQRDLAHKIKEHGKDLWVVREQYCLYIREDDDKTDTQT